LAEWVHGEVVGSEDLLITAARPLKDAQSGHLSFVDHEKHLYHAQQSPASALIAPRNFKDTGKTMIYVADALGAFADIYARLHGIEQQDEERIHARACIDDTATIGARANIGANVVIGARTTIGQRCRISPGVVIGRGCILGDDVTIYPNAVLYDGTIVGNRVILHAGAVIGADGFGYRTLSGKHVKVPQLGNVVLQDDVEIGANTTIDRGTFGSTVICEGTKIDNLVMIGHNCRIGRHNLFVSQVGIAGSCKTGDYVVIAGQAGIADHCTIGDFTQVGGKAGVHKDIAARQKMLGNPATTDKEYLRSVMCIAKLPELRREVKRIQDHLGLE